MAESTIGGDDLSNGQHEGGESEVWDHHEESEDWSHEAADEGNRTTEDATRPATESYGRNDSGRSQDTTRLGFMKKGSHYTRYRRIHGDLGERQFYVSLENSQGLSIPGEVSSTEIAGSTAPLLLSLPSQEAFGLVVGL